MHTTGVVWVTALIRVARTHMNALPYEAVGLIVSCIPPWHIRHVCMAFKSANRWCKSPKHLAGAMVRLHRWRDALKRGVTHGGG